MLPSAPTFPNLELTVNTLTSQVIHYLTLTV